MTLEKNIERIADALEAVVKIMGAGGSAEEKEAVTPQAASLISGQPSMDGAQGSWQGQQSIAQGGQIPVSPQAGQGVTWQGAVGNTIIPGSGNVVSQQPGSQYQSPGGTGMVPTTAATRQYTFDQLAVATANLASSGKDVFQILGKFGVNMLLDLPPERFGEYAAALREAGGVV